MDVRAIIRVARKLYIVSYGRYICVYIYLFRYMSIGRTCFARRQRLAVNAPITADKSAHVGIEIQLCRKEDRLRGSRARGFHCHSADASTNET